MARAVAQPNEDKQQEAVSTGTASFVIAWKRFDHQDLLAASLLFHLKHGPSCLRFPLCSLSAQSTPQRG